MKQFIIKITFFSLLMAGLSSCKKWLDLQPEDQFTQEQVYTNPTRIAQALNGLYATLSDNNMYGGRMSMTTLELLAQRYFINAGATGERPQVQQYAYDKTDAQNAFEAIWRNSYNAVSDINEFIGSLETYSVSVLDAPTLALYKGEAIGLRSMIQLDMLRLFGPVYRTDSTLPAVPYYNKVATALSPLLPANQAMDSILRDLRMASDLLSADPVITQGPMHTLLYDGRDFARLRNYRMNYYAVQLLLARAELYRGNTNTALLIAETALQGTNRWFPWVEGSRTMISVDPDRVYYTEVLMGLYHAKLAENHKAWFAADVTDASIYRPEQNVLDATFEGYGNDVRYHDSWVLSGAKSYKTFLKYQAPGVDSAWYQYMPVLRNTELYYIAAECQPDAAKALAYLNQVRAHRGLPALAATVNIQNEIRKEYMKEFYGEGQLFYYYKRRAETTIPSAISTGATIAMNKAKYVVPLPLSETQYR